LHFIAISDTHRLGRTPLDERSTLRRDRYPPTHISQETSMNARDGLRTCNPSKKTAAGLHPKSTSVSN